MFNAKKASERDCSLNRTAATAVHLGPKSTMTLGKNDRVNERLEVAFWVKRYGLKRFRAQPSSRTEIRLSDVELESMVFKAFVVLNNRDIHPEVVCSHPVQRWTTVHHHR